MTDFLSMILKGYFPCFTLCSGQNLEIRLKNIAEKMDFVEGNYFLVRRNVRQKSDVRSLEILLTTLLLYSIVNYLRSINLHFVIESVYP